MYYALVQTIDKLFGPVQKNLYLTTMIRLINFYCNLEIND